MGGGEVLRKGWLIKSPPLDSGGIKAWRKRFFRLRSSKILEYYKSEDGDLKGVINLEDCKSVNSDLFHKKYKYVFDIETHDRVFYLVATSSEEMTQWVDTLCNVCGFTLKTPVTHPQSSKTISTIKHSKGDAVISPPVSTLPQNVSGSLLSEKFGVEENQSDVYSLASAALYDVHTKLGRHADVPAGTSLSDALTAKGMAPSPCNSIYSQAAAYTPLPDSAYFSPREKDVSDLYAVPDKKKKLPKQSVDQAKKNINPNHRVLSSTKSDAGSVSRSMLSEEEAPKLQSSASVSSGFRPAETMPNGYMRPSQWNSNPRPANYSYVSGPPRPADASSTTHRSALLKMEEDLTPSDEKKDSPEYINLRELREELGRVNAPPQIDRSVKPSPPSAQRNLKPGPNLDIDSPPASPPNFPSRTGSVSTPTIVDATDLPRPTRRTMKYTQLDFDSESGQLCFVADQPVGDSSLRAPVPIPRSTSKSKRVTYSDINILATVEMAANSSTEPEEATQKRLSLNEAEMAALAEKPYVNVARDGLPDDETDPDYYTHMRDLPADSLLYVLMTKKGDGKCDEDLYQEPRR